MCHHHQKSANDYLLWSYFYLIAIIDRIQEWSSEQTTITSVHTGDIVRQPVNVLFDKNIHL